MIVCGLVGAGVAGGLCDAYKIFKPVIKVFFVMAVITMFVVSVGVKDGTKKILYKSPVLLCVCVCVCVCSCFTPRLRSPLSCGTQFAYTLTLQNFLVTIIISGFLGEFLLLLFFSIFVID